MIDLPRSVISSVAFSQGGLGIVSDGVGCWLWYVAKERTRKNTGSPKKEVIKE